jgi:hypothetical protein
MPQMPHQVLDSWYSGRDSMHPDSDTVPDAVPDAESDAISDAVPDAVPDAISDSVSDAVSDAVSNTTPYPIPDTIPDTVPDAISNTLANAFPDTLANTTLRCRRIPRPHRCPSRQCGVDSPFGSWKFIGQLHRMRCARASWKPHNIQAHFRCSRHSDSTVEGGLVGVHFNVAVQQQNQH